MNIARTLALTTLSAAIAAGSVFAADTAQPAPAPGQAAKPEQPATTTQGKSHHKKHAHKEMHKEAPKETKTN